MEQDFMKMKAPFPLVLTMALPMVLSMLVNALYNIVDSYFIAKISEDAMTALSLVYPLQNLVVAAGVGFGIGINAVAARYLGAGDTKLADRAISQGMVLSIVHGLVLTIGCLAILPGFLRLFTNDEKIISYARCYSNIVFSFFVIVTSEIAFEKIFQAVGKMKISMICMLAGSVVNVILDPILIFGMGFVPGMGIKGAAIATGIGQMVTLVIYILIYLKKPLPIRLRLRGMFSGKKMFGQLYGVGIPAGLNMALPSVLVTALNGILAQYSQMYVFVLGIYYKLQLFIYLTANGIVQGIRPLVGFNYGAREYSRVKQIYRAALCQGCIVMLAGMGVCLLFSENLVGLFAESAYTIRAGASALRIICMGFVISTVSVMTSGMMEGLGKGFSSLLISLIRNIAIIPIAFLLSRGIGVTGVWHAFWITECIAAVISYLLYRHTVKKY